MITYVHSVSSWTCIFITQGLLILIFMPIPQWSLELYLATFKVKFSALDDGKGLMILFQ